MTIGIADLVRSPSGTKEIYIMHSAHEKSYFLKKISTYAKRAKAKVAVKVATLIWEDEDTVERMVSVKVIIGGKKRKRPGRK